jgi:hypothetical protein
VTITALVGHELFFATGELMDKFEADGDAPKTLKNKQWLPDFRQQGVRQAADRGNYGA